MCIFRGYYIIVNMCGGVHILAMDLFDMMFGMGRQRRKKNRTKDIIFQLKVRAVCLFICPAHSFAPPVALPRSLHCPAHSRIMTHTCT